MNEALLRKEDPSNDPFMRGVLCYEAYGSREDNPYNKEDIDYFLFDRGYSEAKHGYYSSEEGYHE